MLLAWLLVKNGIRVAIIERHPDFSREFRGEGIQASVMKHLDELGLMDQILKKGMGIRAEAARVFFDNKPVAVLKGIDGNTDFGLILHQEKFLAHLHEKLSESPLYTSYLGYNATQFDGNDEKIVSVRIADKQKKEQSISADVFFITTGRGTALRKKLGLKSFKVATHWNILWILLPEPEQKELLPKGFRAYLNGDSLFIMYTNSEGMIQLAWGRRDENVLKQRDFDQRKSALLSEIPRQYKTLIERGYTQASRSQFLKVECDRLHQWHKKNVLFLGDAAHTMTPVAGQGINLAMRDSIVAANHCIPVLQNNHPIDQLVFHNIQKERIKEVKMMQKFQQKFGYFMLGAPKWQSKIFFLILLPVLKKVGIQKRMLRKIQAGVSDVRFEHKS